jgi:hypothetical protein
MNNNIALIISGFLIAMGIYCSSPRYELVTISNSSNPAAWKFDRFNGDVFLCATPSGKDSEAGCSAKLKQF